MQGPFSSHPAISKATPYGLAYKLLIFISKIVLKLFLSIYHWFFFIAWVTLSKI